jgi:hypothetical protein
MPPRGVESSKRKRQHEHIKESELKRGLPEKTRKVLLRLRLIKLEKRKEKQKAKDA